MCARHARRSADLVEVEDEVQLADVPKVAVQHLQGGRAGQRRQAKETGSS